MIDFFRKLDLVGNFVGLKKRKCPLLFKIIKIWETMEYLYNTNFQQNIFCDLYKKKLQ